MCESHSAKNCEPKLLEKITTLWKPEKKNGLEGVSRQNVSNKKNAPCDNGRSLNCWKFAFFFSQLEKKSKNHRTLQAEQFFYVFLAQCFGSRSWSEGPNQTFSNGRWNSAIVNSYFSAADCRSIVTLGNWSAVKLETKSANNRRI